MRCRCVASVMTGSHRSPILIVSLQCMSASPLVRGAAGCDEGRCPCWDGESKTCARSPVNAEPALGLALGVDLSWDIGTGCRVSWTHCPGWRYAHPVQDIVCAHETPCHYAQRRQGQCRLTRPAAANARPAAGKHGAAWHCLSRGTAQRGDSGLPPGGRRCSSRIPEEYQGLGWHDVLLALGDWRGGKAEGSIRTQQRLPDAGLLQRW